MNQGLGPFTGHENVQEGVDKSARARLLDVTFDAGDIHGSYVSVVFVDQDGNPASEESARIIEVAKVHGAFPRSARMPSGEITHDVIFHGSSALLVIQLNKKKRMTLADVRKVGGQIVRALEHEKFKSAVVHFEGAFKVPGGKKEAFMAFVHGLQAATYALTDFKTEKKERALKKVAILFNPYGPSDDPPYEKLRDLVNDIVVAEHLSRRWIDLPAQAGAMSTDDLVRHARIVAAQHEDDVEIKVIRGDELKKKGLNLLWNVGKGRTDSPPALVVLRYRGADEQAPTIALVGKGIVFDTGGENLKTGGGIDRMHADMAGAAIALATIDLVARRKAKVNLVVALAIADNSVSGSSYHPRSVLKSYRGKTVEVLDTDAEGRLVLADAVAYAEDTYKPDYLVTLATLTGACVVALGNEFAGLFAKTERIAGVIEEASKRSWNKVWRLPLTEAIHTKLDTSSIADVTNLGPRWGGAITAAKFILEEFAKTKHAAHLDVAGVAASMVGNAVDATSADAKFSTGWGPSLLWEVLQTLSKEY